MGKKVDCSCGGSNENCVHCGGLGEYTIGSVGGTKRQRTKKQKQNPSLDLLPLVGKFGDPKQKNDAQIKMAVRLGGGQEVVCPHRQCDFRGSRDELSRHLRSKHSDSERPLDGKDNQPECIEWMRCPLCEAHLHRGGFILHLKLNHKTTWEAVEQFACNASVGSSHSVAPPHCSVECTLCGKTIPIEDVELHLDLQHATDTAHLSKLLVTREHKLAVQFNEQQPQFLGVAERNQQDTLEAHRYMGFVIREHGRFGSHPLHDKHDDESIP